MKIIKQAVLGGDVTESVGILLGIWHEDGCEVTQALPRPSSLDADSKDLMDAKDKDRERERDRERQDLDAVARHMAQVGLFEVDLGWYVVSDVPVVSDKKIIEGHMQRVGSKHSNILLVMSPEKLARGSACGAFRAYRMTRRFAQESNKKEDHLVPRDLRIMEEVPLRLKNTVLVDAFIQQQAAAGGLFSAALLSRSLSSHCDTDALEHAMEAAAEKLAAYHGQYYDVWRVRGGIGPSGRFKERHALMKLMDVTMTPETLRYLAEEMLTVAAQGRDKLLAEEALLKR